MNVNRTLQALAFVTDEGLFERLATTVLREAEACYASLVHTGVNVDGRTVKAPSDGICYVPGAKPPHLIVVHHTITARNNLQRKWLYDPDATTPHGKSKKSSTPPGDFTKTATMVAEKRKEVPDLRATLVLTTNQEPPEAVISEVETAGRAHDIEIDLWSRSRLADFLDNNAVGHWIRHEFLQIEQELLSPELLHRLSLKSLEVNHPPDDAEAWIPRALDTTLASNLSGDVTFLVAGTGQGKSIACYRKLAAHVQAGGFGVVLSHDIVASTITLDQAIAETLRQLHPALAPAGETALSICSPDRPLLLVVEDISRANQTQLLVEKIAKWSCARAKNEDGMGARWRLLCPLWPEKLALLGDQARRSIESLLLFAGGFSENEGRDAVIARARLIGNDLSPLSALSISRSLGHDPLLIALHDFDNTPDPGQVIGQFVDASLSRTAAVAQDHPPAEYRKALRVLAEGVLLHRQVDLRWQDVRDWPEAQGEPLRLIGRIAQKGELIRLMGSSADQRLVFRHDRVREWILADAAADLERRDALPDDVVADPYFAEVIGAVLVRSQPEPGFLQRVTEVNPLALFHALRLFSNATQSPSNAILEAIASWVDNPATHGRSNLHLRKEALAVLAETDFHCVPALVRKFSFSDQIHSGHLARLRNGDTVGGIGLCATLDPGISDPWRDDQIEHARLWHGTRLTRDLDEVLRRGALNGSARSGALRLAGHIGDSSLACAIEVCWNLDPDRCDHLADYLWAFGQCCGDDPARFLEPVCDAWAALPDEPESEGGSSPRNNLADHELRFAFRRWPPHTAIDYFVQRATHEDLKWPITFMLHSVDHPKALAFVAGELAAIHRQLEEPGLVSPLMLMEWQRAQEDGRPMSDASRECLLRLWQDDENDKHLRTAAFSLWAATKREEDLDILRTARVPDDFADSLLHQRLVRGDRQAIHALLAKLRGNDAEYWWQCGRYLWAPELTEELDSFLANRGGQAQRSWLESFPEDRITSELIMRLPTSDAERLLLRHWDHLRFSSYFVQAALYAATKSLLDAAEVAIRECPQPAELMTHLGMGFGIRIKDHPGLHRENQVLALVPYRDIISEDNIFMLWAECNSRGWFATRREYLDSRLGSSYVHHLWSHDRAVQELDRMVERNQHIWVDHWIDQKLKADVSWSEILSTLKAWLDDRQSLKALEVVASVVARRGTRRDIGILRAYEDMSMSGVKELIYNTEFAVRRRTIT